MQRYIFIKKKKKILLQQLVVFAFQFDFPEWRRTAGFKKNAHAISTKNVLTNIQEM